MVLRTTIATAAAAFLVAGSAGAGDREAPSRVLWQGPLIAGGAVLWEEEASGAGSVHLWTAGRGDRPVLTSGTLALGRTPAASAALVAFGRSYPTCAPQPGFACPQAEDGVVGAPTGPFRALDRPHVCALAATRRTLAVDGGVAAYLQVDCARDELQILVRDVLHGGRPRMIHRAAVSAGCCGDLALAGRYVAWTGDHDTGVVVYDRTARRIAYRAATPPGTELAFGLQGDGKLAVAYRPIEFARSGPATVAWFSRSSPRAHVLPPTASAMRIRLVADRILLQRWTGPGAGELDVVDLAGHMRPLVTLPRPSRLRGDFDFDGRRLVWASDRIGDRHADCPPPGQGRPCVLVETGVTTIWRRSASGGPVRRVAQLPFVDAPAR